MRALEWQRRLREQGELYGKRLFRVAELANLAGEGRASVAVQLVRLQRLGVIDRCAPGLYGLPGLATLDDLLLQIDVEAYITGFYALHHHGLVTQVPAVITCFTNRRRTHHELRTTLGRLRLSFVKSPIYHRPDEGIVAPPEQALCDFVYMRRRQGQDATDGVTFRHMDRMSRVQLASILDRYPRTVAAAAMRWAPCSGFSLGITLGNEVAVSQREHHP